MIIIIIINSSSNSIITSSSGPQTPCLKYTNREQMIFTGGTSRPARGHVTPVIFGTAWSRSLNAYHLHMLLWECKRRQPCISEVLRRELPPFLKPPDEIMSLQILALREDQSSGTTGVLALGWYSGQALQVQLPGKLDTQITFATQIANLQNPSHFLDSQRIALGTTSDYETVYHNGKWRCDKIIHMIECSANRDDAVILRNPSFDIYALACAPNGSSLAVAQEFSRLKVWNWAPWHEEKFEWHPEVQAMTFSPRGNLLAIWHLGNTSQHITILRLESGEENRSAPLDVDVFMKYGAVHPKEESVVFVGNAGTHGVLLMFDIRLMQTQLHLDLTHHRWVSEVTYHPTKNIIAVGGAGGIDTLEFESPRLTSLVSDEPVNSVTYTRSGHYLVVSTEHELLLFHMATDPYTMEHLSLPWCQEYHISSVKVLETSLWQHDDVEDNRGASQPPAP